MSFLEREINRLSALACSAHLLEERANLSTRTANGSASQLFPKLREQQMAKARRRFKGARRLRKRIAALAATIETKTLQSLA